MFYAGKNVIFYCFMFILIFFLSSKKWPIDGANNRNIIVRNNVNGFNKPTSFVINSILANRIKIAWFTWISSLSIAWGGYWSLSIAWFWHEAIANFPDFSQWVTSLNSASASVFADCSRGLLQTRQDKLSNFAGFVRIHFSTRFDRGVWNECISIFRNLLRFMASNFYHSLKNSFLWWR